MVDEDGVEVAVAAAEEDEDEEGEEELAREEGRAEGRELDGLVGGQVGVVGEPGEGEVGAEEETRPDEVEGDAEAEEEVEQRANEWANDCTYTSLIVVNAPYPVMVSRISKVLLRSSRQKRGT